MLYRAIELGLTDQTTTRLLRSIEALNAGARRPAHYPESRPNKIGVLGAGFMGAGIAFVTASAGLDVVLIDRDQRLADHGKARCAAIADAHIVKSRLTPSGKKTALSHIFASADFNDLADCGLVIETVPEDRAVKAAVIRNARAVLGKMAVLASNTSTFPITSLAAADERPQDFIGIHFFSPVDKMGLAELVMGEKTGSRALAVAFDYIRALGKTPIIVNDGYQFFANRCVNHYLQEGHLMLLDGVPAELIELAAKEAGMPVGPLALSDEIAIDLVYKILLVTRDELGPQAIDQRQESLLRAMTETYGRHGRKTRKGFYDYPEAQPKTLWPGLSDLPSSMCDPVTIDRSELKLRFLAIQALEAILAVEDGIVSDAREADVGSVLGFGFPAFTGGVLSYVDAMGTAAFLAMCERLAAAYGERFSPPLFLKDLADKSESLYEHFAKKAQAA